MYKLLLLKIKDILDTEDSLSAMCNITSLLYHELDKVNWVGYYLYKDGKLQLGPFQGKMATPSIEIGKGICGTAYEKRMLMNINDISNFQGNYSNDPDNCSEVVAPLKYQTKIFGVISICSTDYRHFNEELEEFVEDVGSMIGKKLAGK